METGNAAAEKCFKTFFNMPRNVCFARRGISMRKNKVLAHFLLCFYSPTDVGTV